MKPILDVLVIGGGMITVDQILPSLYHLQRLDRLGEIKVCARRAGTIRALRADPGIREAFPGQTFHSYPPADAPADAFAPDGHQQALAELPPRQIVIVAVGDQFHFDLVMAALRHNQHVICVKPLVLRHADAVVIEAEARKRGLFVGVEYHKRFDRRALLARKVCREGRLGRFVMGEAKLIEPYYYRSSNFQNWFTCDQTDPFVYIGCHYVDQVYFLSGLRPISVSVEGVKGKFPNGAEGYMWAHGRVRYEGDGLLSVVTGLGYPDGGAGSNDQGAVMWFEGDGRTGLIEHDDQFRGVAHSYLEPTGAGRKTYHYLNPDYFKLVPWSGPGSQPVGYGYESVAGLVEAAARVEAAGDDLVARTAVITEIDAQDLIATPANSSFNELLVEAARLSILADGATVDISYAPPAVQLRQ